LDSYSVHHQEFFTVHTAMVYVIQVCWQLSAVSKPVWHIPLLCVQLKIPDDGQRNCPKHVEFYSRNKFEKLVHLVGFIIRISKGLSSAVRPLSHTCDTISMWWRYDRHKIRASQILCMKKHESLNFFSSLNNQDLYSHRKWAVTQKALQIHYLHPQLPLHKLVNHFKRPWNFPLLWRYVYDSATDESVCLVVIASYGQS